MSKINEIIVLQIPDIGDPRTAYLLDNGDGTHDRYVSDEDGNISKQAGGIKTIQAGANITIDNTDPKNPIISSTGGGSLTDTLESVVNMGNYSPKYMTFTGTSTDPTRDGAIGMNTTTYSMYFGNMNSEHTGVYNLGFGYNSLNNLSSGTENISYGHYSLSNLTVGTENIAIGNQTLNALTGTVTESRWNVAIGEHAGRYLTKGSGNVFIGNHVARNLSSAVTEADLAASSPAAVTYMKLVSDISGYNESTASFNSALNTFIGQSVNTSTTSATRAAMSTIIGASGLNNNRFRNFNNIVIGAGNYMLTDNSTMYNSIIIGNSINLPNQVDTLAIGMNRASRINTSDAIIHGLLPNTKLTFNAPITVPSTYMRNAQGDSTYTKQLVAKPNGDIGWEDKNTTNIFREGVLGKMIYDNSTTLNNSLSDIINCFQNDNISYAKLISPSSSYQNSFYIKVTNNSPYDLRLMNTIGNVIVNDNLTSNVYDINVVFTLPIGSLYLVTNYGNTYHINKIQ